jgi:hypothetical protein
LNRRQRKKYIGKLKKKLFAISKELMRKEADTKKVQKDDSV